MNHLVDRKRKLVLFIFVIFLASCAIPLPPTGQLIGGSQHKIVGWNAQNYFVDAQGNTFFPWGFNYTNPQHIGLIDDMLYAEENWQAIAQDFAEMKAYSANTVRVHLQYHRFMLDPHTPNERAFQALHRLVDIAEANGLYLIVTGLGAFEKSKSPAWYDDLSTAARWQTQSLFWATLAGEVGDRSAIFAYDLMNEPVVSVCPPETTPCSWQVGKPLGGYYFVQNISIDEGLKFAPTMSAWIAQLTAAIRREDPITLTTTGLLSATPLAFFEEDLDFISAHVYPQCERLQDSVKYLSAAGKRRPLVVSETFNLACNIDELKQVLDAVAGRLHGIIGHYDGQTPQELMASDEVADRLRLEFLEYFIANTPDGA